MIVFFFFYFSTVYIYMTLVSCVCTSNVFYQHNKHTKDQYVIKSTLMPNVQFPTKDLTPHNFYSHCCYTSWTHLGHYRRLIVQSFILYIAQTTMLFHTLFKSELLTLAISRWGVETLLSCSSFYLDNTCTCIEIGLVSP